MARRRWPANVALGCGGLLGTTVAAVAVLSWLGGAALDRRAARLPAELEAHRAGLPVERPAFGGSALEGNAADDYRELAVLVGTDELAERPDLDANAGLRALLAKSRDARRALLPPPPEAVEALHDRADLLERVRDGLRRGRCDWAPELELGMGAPSPDANIARNAAELLALTAQLEADGEQAARICRELLAFGAEFPRHGSLIGVMLGVLVHTVAVDSLEHTLRTRALPRRAYEELLAALDDVAPVDLARCFEAERLGMSVELARLTGRGFGAPGASPLAKMRVFGPAFFEREWAGYERFLGRVRSTALLPAVERGPAVDALEADLADSWLLVARLALPNLANAAEHLDTLRAYLGLARMLVAAHLHRLETGAFPADGAALASRLGGRLPADPFAAGDGPLSYRLVGAEVRCWSVGRNLVDEGGDGRWTTTKDLVLITSAPPPEERR